MTTPDVDVTLGRDFVAVWQPFQSSRVRLHIIVYIEYRCVTVTEFVFFFLNQMVMGINFSTFQIPVIPAWLDVGFTEVVLVWKRINVSSCETYIVSRIELKRDRKEIRAYLQQCHCSYIRCIFWYLYGAIICVNKATTLFKFSILSQTKTA